MSGGAFKTGLAFGTTLAFLSACAPDCGPFPGTRQTTAQLYMGLSLPGGGEVDAQAWQDFLDHQVTPRFPDGLTVFDAYGQWRGPNGTEVRERSKVVTIVLPSDSKSAALLTAIADAYKTRFHQQSVGIVTAPSCAAW